MAAIQYVNSVSWVSENFPMMYKQDGIPLLNTRGIIVGVLLMLLFTAMNLAGAEFLSESNVILVLWKTAVPFLAIVVIASLSFHPSNFTAGGGFMPFGMHGVFAALPGGVVFALQVSNRPSSSPARPATHGVTCLAPSSSPWASARSSTRCCRSP